MQTAAVAKQHPRTAVRPAVVDDFIRNFLIARKMERTLDSFGTEWYEKQAKGQLQEEDVGVVPDIYLRNLDLDEQVKTLQVEVAKMRDGDDACQLPRQPHFCYSIALLTQTHFFFLSFSPTQSRPRRKVRGTSSGRSGISTVCITSVLSRRKVN